MNPRITPRERGLLKGAIRRVFARSDLRRKVVDAAIIEHTDSSRKRVKTWVRCSSCGKPEAKSNVVVDHIIPVIDVNSSFEEQGADVTIDRTWCEESNLQVICISPCHENKTKEERKLRSKNKKSNKNGR